MRSRWNLPVLIAYMLVALTLLGALVLQLGFVAPWQHPYTVTANFSDADGILPGNDVDMNGVLIGRVNQVRVSDGSAWVSMTISDGAALPLSTTTTAEVRTKNLLGETYIDLQRGNAGCHDCTLTSGAIIPMSRTVPITEIDQVLAVFDPSTVERVQLLINALGEGTAGQGSTLNQEAASSSALITSLEVPATELSVRRQQIGTIVTEMQALYAMLAAQRAQTAAALTTWNQVMAQLATQEASIGGTIQQADQLMTQLNQLVTGEAGPVRDTLAELPGALASANGFLRTSGSLLGSLAPYRGDIHAIFPNLASSFADTDAQGQHFWSVYSVNCTTGCSPAAAPSGTATTASGSSPGDAVFNSEGGS